MKIWVVNSEEPLPMLTGQGRVMRGGMLAEFFAKQGHDVTWWCSTFLHYEKRFLEDHSCTKELGQNLRLQLVHVKKAYRRNVSPARIVYCRNLAKNFHQALKTAEKPDAIYCAWPHIELAYECVHYGEELNIPVVIDIRDFWPDIFTQPFHGPVQKMAQVVVDLLYKKQTEYVMQHASRVIGVAPKCMDLAKKYGRKLQPEDRAVYQSFAKADFSNQELQEEYRFWQQKGITKEDFLVVYLGSIEKRGTDLDVVIEAGRNCTNTRIKFVFCGNGPALEECVHQAEDLENVLFPGYMNLKQMCALCRMAKIGVIPYYNTEDFEDSLPSKLSEYLSYGLPVLTTLNGLTREKLESSDCGGHFQNAAELCGLIDDYYRDPDRRNRQSENALQLFQREFNAENVYEDLLEDMVSLAHNNSESGDV